MSWVSLAPTLDFAQKQVEDLFEYQLQVPNGLVALVVDFLDAEQQVLDAKLVDFVQGRHEEGRVHHVVLLPLSAEFFQEILGFLENLQKGVFRRKYNFAFFCGDLLKHGLVKRFQSPEPFQRQLLLFAVGKRYLAGILGPSSVILQAPQPGPRPSPPVFLFASQVQPGEIPLRRRNGGDHSLAHVARLLFSVDHVDVLQVVEQHLGLLLGHIRNLQIGHVLDATDAVDDSAHLPLDPP